VLVAGIEIEQFLFDSRNWRQKKFDARRIPDCMTHASVLQILASILWRQFLELVLLALD